MTTLRRLVADTLRLPLSAVNGSTAMRTTGQWDSLKHMELILAIEERYDLTLDGDEIAALTNVGAIEKLLRDKGRGP